MTQGAAPPELARNPPPRPSRALPLLCFSLLGIALVGAGVRWSQDLDDPITRTVVTAGAANSAVFFLLLLGLFAVRRDTPGTLRWSHAISVGSLLALAVHWVLFVVLALGRDDDSSLVFAANGMVTLAFSAVAFSSFIAGHQAAQRFRG